MSRDNEAFLRHLLATFRVEADEHLRTMASLVVELEQPVSAERAPQLVETLFREAHSLKGAARSVGLSEVEAVCSELEAELARLKRREVEVSPPLLATLDRGIDEVGRLLAASSAAAAAEAAGSAAGAGGTLVSPEVATPAASPAGQALDQPPAAGAAGPPPERSERPPPLVVEAGETIRISTAKLAALLVQSEELLAFKFSAGHLAAELSAVDGEVADWKKACGSRVRDVAAWRREREKVGSGVGAGAGPMAAGGRRARALDKLCEAVEGDERFAKALHERLRRLHGLAERERRAFASLVDSLQEDMKQVLMQPFAALFELLPKLVRDLARDAGKEVELQVEGAAIEIDCRILEQMKDPLIHLARNALDHGIESPAERLRRGKPRQGRLVVTVAPREGNRLELLFADDGAGIDLAKVKAAALALGLVAPADAERLAAPQLQALAFESGLSTSPILTDISGRGLGLAIVREKVEKLGGSVGIELPATGGTQFRIVLPTMLANFRGLLVALGERQFVLPSRSVERVARIAVASLKTVENREAIELAGQAVALARLADLLGLPAAPGAAADHLAVVVLANAGKRIAFAVDAVLGDQEVLVKGLGPQLQRVRNVAGATVLGAGSLVPILSVPDLFASALRVGPRPAAPKAPAAAAGGRKSLLVVEDSITSRALLKNILESAGYAVATAVDGVDALTFLHAGQFDLVVSDVEMPRMDGFDLTARIRSDKKLAELPVVLVTALASREHKERGIDVGADAYIDKSSFDQSDLLEVIRRLV